MLDETSMKKWNIKPDGTIHRVNNSKSGWKLIWTCSGQVTEIRIWEGQGMPKKETTAGQWSKHYKYSSQESHTGLNSKAHNNMFFFIFKLSTCLCFLMTLFSLQPSCSYFLFSQNFLLLRWIHWMFNIFLCKEWQW